MIERLQIENFKSFRKVDLKLGACNLFIGSNASGKSNLLEALRVLQGIGYGFSFSEILDGRPKGANSEVWEGIRGGSALARFGEGEVGEPIRFWVDIRHPRDTQTQERSYEIAFDAETGTRCDEKLRHGNKVVYSSKGGNHAMLPVAFVFLFAKDSGEQDIVGSFIHDLANMQRLDPIPEMLRGYSPLGQVQRLGDRGENFASLVQAICEKPETKEAFVAWLRELRPAEVDDVAILKGALGEPMFAVKERGRVFPAPVLSDGTLRFAAIAAAFFQPEMPAMLTLEEIEKGIHASRLRLLLELLKSQATRTGTQVMATSHSPALLNWLDEEDYPHVFFCHRDAASGESRIVPLSEIPHLQEAAKHESLGDLFAENWLEAAL